MAHSTPNISESEAVVHLHSSTSIVGDARLSSTAVWNALIDTSTWPRWNAFVPRVTIREQPSQQPATRDNSHDDDDDDDDDDDSGSNAGQNRQVLSPILQLGTRMTFHVDMSAGVSSSKNKSPEDLRETPLVVTVFEPPDPATKKPGRIVWAGDSTAPGGFSEWLLRAKRTHEIYQEETADGRVTVHVANWELQKGVLAYAVRWMYGQRLQKCFERWVDDLRGFVERELHL